MKNNINALKSTFKYKSHILKKLIASTLAFSLIASTVPVMALEATAQTATASATTSSQGFTDLKGYEWAASSINAMASKGVVKGVGNNKYAPQDNVTREQFASMILRSFGNDKVSQLAQQASDKAKTDSNYTSLDKLNETYKGNWSNEVICAIQMFPSLDKTWGVSAEAWSANASREEMALIIMTIAEQLGNEKFAIKENIQNNIGDWNLVSKLDNKDSILKAYSNGILVGTNDQGNYSPNNNANRAEAAVVMQRVIDPSKRTEVVVKEAEKPVVPPVQEGDNVGKYGTVYPVEGNGITRDATTGVLGFGNGQTGGIYLGIQMKKADGSVHSTIKVNSYALDDYDNMHASDKYTNHNGYTFWSTEWQLIKDAASTKVKAAVKPSASTVGTKADIYGNIIKAGDTTTPAFWEIQQGFDIYAWQSLM